MVIDMLSNNSQGPRGCPMEGATKWGYYCDRLQRIRNPVKGGRGRSVIKTEAREVQF